MFSRKTARRRGAAGRVAAVCVAAVFAACSGGGKGGGDTLVVSIEPLRFIVDGITGGGLDVEVLTPPGSSPETYEPSPAQIAAAERARLVFSTGLICFENAVIDRLGTPDRSVVLSEGIELMESDHVHAGLGDAGVHDRGDEGGREGEEVHGNEGAHATEHPPHGSADPHIWMSPRALARMAETAYRRIHEAYPDSTSYTANYAQLAERLARLDAEVSRRLAASSERAFMILHPGLTYYARDYGLRQIALERDGKEPSAGQLAETVTLARAEGVRTVMYQNEFPVRMVEVAATEIGARAAEIDILGYDVETNILKITDLIAR